MRKKQTKEAADYTPVAAMQSQRCDKCRHFLAMYEMCRLVEGHIKPGAWCKLFEKLHAEQRK